MTSISKEQLQALAPQAFANYRDAILNGQAVLDQFQISSSPLRMAHFFAQILHESSILKAQHELLNYSPESLVSTFPKYFLPIGKLNPADYAHNGEKFANAVYGNRMGNTDPNDGFTYRGRGILQLTGKDNYKSATIRLRKTNPTVPDFVKDPEAVLSTQWSLAVAASFWAEHGCNAAADKDDLKAVTQIINGGQKGIVERGALLKQTKAMFIK